MFACVCVCVCEWLRVCVVGTPPVPLPAQCNEYSECDSLDPFLTAGKAVFNVEYNVSPQSFCPADNKALISVGFSPLSLPPPPLRTAPSRWPCLGPEFDGAGQTGFVL